MENRSKGTRKIFDDFPKVDCNECEHWWTNACDAVQKGQERVCMGFKASRSVVIPQEIKWLKTRLKWLTVALGVFGALFVTIIILIYYFNI